MFVRVDVNLDAVNGAGFVWPGVQMNGFDGEFFQGFIQCVRIRSGCDECG